MKIKLASILCISLSGDSLITVSLIWLIIKLGGDTRILGLFLFINTVIPYLSQVYLRRHASLNFNPVINFIITRMIGAILSLVLATGFYFYNNISMLYISACVFTVINFFSNQYIEAYFGTLVLHKKIDANMAARIQQTSVQLSVLLGASISGFIIASGGFLAVLFVNILTYLFGVWGFCQKLNSFHSDLPKGYIENKIFQLDSKTPKKHTHIIANNFLLLIILAITLYSFNFLLPFLVQKDRGWSAIEFGIIDAIAASGAFISVVIINKGLLGQVSNRISYPLIIASLIGFFFVREPFEAIILGFLFGFSLNCLRIKVREHIFNSTTSTDLALKFGQNITFINMMSRALIPLVLGWVVMKLPAANIFLDLGIVCSLALIISMLFSISLARMNFKNN